MSKIVYGHLRDYLKLSRKESRKPILGKGINMALSSLVSSDFTEDGVSDKDTVLVYMDAENNTVDSNDPFLLGAPLIYEDSPKKFIKAAFKRYHMDGDRRKLGGRVNASLGVPLIHMLIHEGLMQIGKPITYPLSGEIGIDRDLFWSLKTSKKYGVETATLLQLFGKESENRITEEDFSQVDLGINMDQPLAEGDPPDEVLKKVKRMSDDILSTTLQIMGGQIRKTWKYKDFMDMFEDFQRKSIERWIESHDNNVITGGINHEDLRETVFDAVSQRIDRHYHGDSPFRTRLQKIRNLLYRDDTDGFVPSIMEIKKELGGKFDEFRIKLKDHSKRIYPEE